MHAGHSARWSVWIFGAVAVTGGMMLALMPARAQQGSSGDARQTIAIYRSFAVAQNLMLSQLKANLAEKRTIESKYKVLDAASAKYDREIEEANAFCRGRFDEAEYERRLKICRNRQRKLDALVSAIKKVRDTIEAQDAARQQRALKLKADYDALGKRAGGLESRMAGNPAFASVMKQCAKLSGLAARSACVKKNWVPPKPGRAVYLLDALEAGKGDWNESVNDLQIKLARDPKNAAVRDALSYVMGLRDGHLALSKLQNVRYKKGVLAWMEGDYKEAALHFSQSFEIDPSDKGALQAYGFVSGLDQARTNAGALAPCYLVADCDPLFHSREFAAQLSLRSSYRLLSDDQRRQLYRLRVEVARNPQDLKKRATLQYVDGLSAWDDFRDQAKKGAGKIYDMSKMVAGLTRMGRGDYKGAVVDFARGLDENWGEDGLTFSYFHAMGLNEGVRANPKYTPRIWDERTAKIYQNLYRDELRVLIGGNSKTIPPWQNTKRKLRREERAAWSRFLTDPFKRTPK